MRRCAELSRGAGRAARIDAPYGTVRAPRRERPRARCDPLADDVAGDGATRAKDTRSDARSDPPARDALNVRRIMSVRLHAVPSAASASDDRGPACAPAEPPATARGAPSFVPPAWADPPPTRPDASVAVGRVLAVGWSGAPDDAARRIWLCEVRDDRVVRLECGRSREALVAHVIAEAARDPRLVVGFDFPFSLPAWFVAAHGGSAGALWRRALVDGDVWIERAAPPFWRDAPGTVAQREPALDPFRRTEREVAARTGRRPTSAFHVGGAGSVGAASIRGMPCLAHLRAAGFAVWPFDPAPPGVPAVVELWPPLCGAAGGGGEAAGRAAVVATRAGDLPVDERHAAEGTDAAFATLNAALALWDGRHALAELPAARDVLDRLEGRIWEPPRPDLH